jgi:hypothetical protein
MAPSRRTDVPMRFPSSVPARSFSWTVDAWSGVKNRSLTWARDVHRDVHRDVRVTPNHAVEALLSGPVNRKRRHLQSLAGGGRPVKNGRPNSWRFYVESSASTLFWGLLGVSLGGFLLIEFVGYTIGTGQYTNKYGHTFEARPLLGEIIVYLGLAWLLGWLISVPVGLVQRHRAHRRDETAGVEGSGP